MSRAARSPGTLVALGLLVVLAVAFAALGRWQLARAEQHRTALEGFDAAADLPALTLDELGPVPEAARYRRLSLTGHYLTGSHVLLDNMTRAGRAGFEVLTPFAPAGHDGLVLVNRGWIEADPARVRWPDVTLDSAAMRVSGRIADFPRAALSLGRVQAAADGGRIVMSYPSVEELDRLFEATIMPFQLRLDAGLPNGFVRDWVPDAERPARNVGYALQWFAFSVVAIGGAALLAWRALRSPGA